MALWVEIHQKRFHRHQIWTFDLAVGFEGDRNDKSKTESPPCCPPVHPAPPAAAAAAAAAVADPATTIDGVALPPLPAPTILLSGVWVDAVVVAVAGVVVEIECLASVEKDDPAPVDVAPEPEFIIGWRVDSDALFCAPKLLVLLLLLLFSNTMLSE